MPISVPTPTSVPSSGIKLTSLRLERFKNFRDARLALGPLSVLVGTNASGKSNVRDAFRFLHGIGRGYSLAEIIGEKWGEGGVLQWRGIRGGTLEAAFAESTDFSLSLEFMALRPRVISNLIAARLIGGQGSYFISVAIGDSGKPPRVIRERLTFASITVFDSHPSNDPLSSGTPDPDHLPVRLMKGAKQRGPYGQKLNCLSLRPALSQVAENAKLKDAKLYAKLVLETLQSMRFLDLDPDALRRPSIPGQTVLGDKGENLSSVLQAICGKPELKTALASWVAELTPMDATDFEFPSDQQGRILLSLIEQGGARISAYSASDGTLRFLAMIAALLGPESSRFYFFEELDNGIHPARLHLLLGLIEREAAHGTVQMVATTHSPELLALLDQKSLDYASLIYRLPDSNEGRIRRILDIPDAPDVIAKQDLARLHATGWLEDAVYFTSDNQDGTQ